MSVVAFTYSSSQEVHQQYVNSWSLYSKLDIVIVLLTVNIKQMLTQEVSNPNDRIYLDYLLWTWELQIVLITVNIKNIFHANSWRIN